jgi:ATP synthase protein I
MGDDLNERIGKAQAEIDARNRPAGLTTGKGVGLGFKMASDFTAAVIVGLVLGWGVDALFHTSPWGLLACLLLGFVAGVRNIVVAATAANREAAGGAASDGSDRKEGE